MTREEANKELDVAITQILKQLDFETTIRVLQDLNSMTAQSLCMIMAELQQAEEDAKQPSNC